MQPNFTTTYAGHKLHLAVAGLVLFGSAPLWNDEDGFQKLTNAIVITGNNWIAAPLANSKSLGESIKALAQQPIEEAKDSWMAAVAATACNFLTEYGGLTGLLALRDDVLARAKEEVLKTLHEHPFTNVTRTAPAGDRSSEPKMVFVDMSGDVEAQLKEQGVPAADTLRQVTAIVNDEDEPKKEQRTIN